MGEVNSDPHYYYVLFELMKENNFQEQDLIVVLKTMLSKNAQHFKSWFELGKLYLRQNKLDFAEKCFFQTK